MTAQDKYREALFFNDKIRDKNCKKPEIDYYLSALLSSISSIPDHILEEANNHYNLQISDDTVSFRRRFAQRVKKVDDYEISRFFNTWSEQTILIEENKVLHYRHLNIHRREVKVVLGKYLVSNCPDDEQDVVERYQRYFSLNEGWEDSSYDDVCDYRSEIRCWADISEFDPHFSDVTSELIKKSPPSLGFTYALYTTYYVQNADDLIDPVCILCLKLLAVYREYINRLNKSYPWLTGI